MSDDQHHCQASVGASVLRGKTGRMRVALPATAGIPSALAPLLIKEVRFAHDGADRQRQELSYDSCCPLVCCSEPEAADLDFECSFVCGLGTGGLDTLAFAVPSRRWCSQVLNR